MTARKLPKTLTESLPLSHTIVLALLGVFLLVILQCTRSSSHKLAYPGTVRHVIFISLDTTRPDHFGCYGNPWIRTPHLDQLAAESILFTDYMTVVPTTLASHTSLFTGKYAHTHGTPRNGFIVNPKNVMLAEILKSVAFHTVGFIGSFVLNSRFNFAQGFDYYNQEFDKFRGMAGRTQNERSAKSVTDAVIRYLDKTGIPPNLFLFVHYFDPHKPHDPPPPYNQLYVSDEGSRTPHNIVAHYDFPQKSGKEDSLYTQKALNYAAEISFMDEQVGRLINYFKEKEIMDEAVLVVTSDHGENFWEHEVSFSHGKTTYQTTMRCVCIIRLPQAAQAGTKVDSLVASIDILPTLLNYLGLPIPEDIDGKPFDLTNIRETIGRLTRYGQATKPPLTVETDPRWYNLHKGRCVREGKFKYIQTPYAKTEEFYDLSLDPFEQKNLLNSTTPAIATKAKELKEKLEAWAASPRPLKSFVEKKMRKETIKKLKALGYL